MHVNMHGTFEGYIYGSSNSVRRGQQEEKGGREKRKEGREKRKGRKKKREREERREKERRKEKKKEVRERKECYTVSRPGQQRTRNCSTSGRFPSTLVILRLGAM